MTSAISIFKYGLDIADEVVIQMPKGAIIRHVGEQPMSKDNVQIWAQVDRREPLVPRTIRVFGTGHDLPNDPGTYIGTVITRGGMLVWHLYDAGEQQH